MTRELSKRFEETRRGPLEELAACFSGDVKGEIVVVVAGQSSEEAHAQAAAAAPDYAAQAAALAAAGGSARSIRDALMAAGMRKKAAYALALQVTAGGAGGAGAPLPDHHALS